MFEAGKMHLTNDELATLAHAQARESESLRAIRAHLDGCEDCRVRFAEIEGWHIAVEGSMAEGFPRVAQSVADQIYRDAITASRVVLLSPMTMPQTHEPVHLAADGQAETESVRPLEHRATMVSENPELVMRIMRDPASGEETLHLIGADPSVTRHVIIHVDDPPLDLVTDADGKALLTGTPMANPADARWEIRLPDATFALTRLEGMGIDPGGEREVTLSSGPDNEMGITLTEGPDGLALRLRLLRVNGRNNIERARLVISQQDLGDRIIVSALNQPCVVSGLSAAQPIDIRIFAM